jgi:MFS family permease
MAAGLLFMKLCPPEGEAPARRAGRSSASMAPADLARTLLVMTIAAATASLGFNLTTNGNAQMLAERFRGLIEDPAVLGALLAAVYAIASLAQVVVGRLIDRFALKPLYLCITLAQIPLLALAAYAQGWWLFVALLGTMISIFGAIPFTDAMIVRYVDDRMRSRVAGVRLAISLSISSMAFWLLGPFVKGLGFANLMLLLAGVAACTVAVVSMLPSDRRDPAAAKA